MTKEDTGNKFIVKSMELKVNEKKIPIKGFVQEIIGGGLLGMVKSLKLNRIKHQDEPKIS